jgi:hypothetical protein
MRFAQSARFLLRAEVDPDGEGAGRRVVVFTPVEDLMRMTMATALVGALVAAGSYAHADTLVGSIPLPVNRGGPVNGPTEIGAARIFVDWTDYVPSQTGASIRICTSFTDYGMRSDSLTVSLSSTQPNGQLSEVVHAVLGNTWSGAGIFHLKCGPKTPMTDFSVCGKDFGNSCRLFAVTNNPYTVIFNAVWLELFTN